MREELENTANTAVSLGHFKSSVSPTTQFLDSIDWDMLLKSKSKVAEVSLKSIDWLIREKKIFSLAVDNWPFTMGQYRLDG